MRRPLLVAVAAAIIPLAAAAQTPADHPLRATKVGDAASYELTMKVGATEVKGTSTNTVTARSDREVTIEVTGTMNGKAIPPQSHTIDLTKPIDPIAVTGPAAAGTKFEKVEDKAVSLTIGGKDYDTTLTTYKTTLKGDAGEVTADLKVWIGKGIPLGLGKLEMSSTTVGIAMTMRVELRDGKK